MQRFRLHPLFIVMLFLLIISKKFMPAFFTLLAVILHEYAHSYVAKNRGYKLNKLTLMPYGAVIYSEENIHKHDAFYIAIAGITLNLCLCVLTLASWWVFPSTYSVTHIFFKANFFIAIFNLLPAYPLDGARLILAQAKNTMKTLKLLKLSGIFFSIIFLILFIISIFFMINITIGIMAIALFIGATYGTKQEIYTFIVEEVPFIKDKKHPIEVISIMVNKDMELRKIYRYFNKNKFLIIKLIDENNNVIKDFTEKQLFEKIKGYPSSEKICSIINN